VVHVFQYFAYLVKFTLPCDYFVCDGKIMSFKTSIAYAAMETDLEKLLGMRSDSMLSADTAKTIMTQILRGLKACHSVSLRGLIGCLTIVSQYQ
jgi:hypothetical protein